MEPIRTIPAWDEPIAYLWIFERGEVTLAEFSQHHKAVEVYEREWYMCKRKKAYPSASRALVARDEASRYLSDVEQIDAYRCEIDPSHFHLGHIGNRRRAKGSLTFGAYPVESRGNGTKGLRRKGT